MWKLISVMPWFNKAYKKVKSFNQVILLEYITLILFSANARPKLMQYFSPPTFSHFALNNHMSFTFFRSLIIISRAVEKTMQVFLFLYKFYITNWIHNAECISHNVLMHTARQGAANYNSAVYRLTCRIENFTKIWYQQRLKFIILKLC